MLELANKEEEDEEEEPGDLTGLTTETGFASDERGGGERMETVDRLGLVMSSGKEIFRDVSLQFRASKLIFYAYTAEPAYSRLQENKECCLLKEKSTITGIE